MNKFSKALIIAAAAILCAECGISSVFSVYRNNPTNARIKTKIALSRRSELSSDILIFGGSEAAGGINAGRLQEITGFKCFNFALIGDAAIAGNYFLLEDYLQVHAPPRFIILMDSYDIWAREVGDGGVSDTLMINFPLETARLLGYSPLNYVLPSQRYRYEIRALLRSGNIPAYLKSLETRSSGLEQELLGQKGSSFFKERDPASVRRDLTDHQLFIDSNEFNVSRLNLLALDKLLTRAKEKKITVFIAFPPVYKEFFDYGTNSAYLRAYRVFMRSLPQSYDTVVLLNNDFYPVAVDQLSGSIDHLHGDESLVFTEKLGRAMVRYISEKADNSGVRGAVNP
jgi:hypothetical protein